MLILEFFDLSEFFTDLDELPWAHYESVDVRLSVCPSVRLSDKTNFNTKRYKSIFEIYTNLNWTQYGAQSYQERILIFEFLRQFYSKNQNSRSEFQLKELKSVFFNTAYLDRA